MPIRPFKFLPRNLVEWSKFFQSTEVTPDPDSVDNGTIQDGAVTFAKIQSIAANRLLGRIATAGVVGEVGVGGGLALSGSSIERSEITGDVTLAQGGTVATFRDVAATSVIGRAGNTLGAPADISAASDNGFLVRRSGALLFGGIADSDLPSTIARDTEVAAAIAAIESTNSFTATLTGVSGTVTGTARYVKRGNFVSLTVPSLSGTSNATTCTVSGLPAEIQPVNNQGYLLVGVTDNGSTVMGLAALLPGASVITLYPSLTGSSSGWTISGTKGVLGFILNYQIN